MIKIAKVFHADHGIDAATLLWALSHLTTDGFFNRTLTLPESHIGVSCGLYGPSVGDAPIADDATYMVVRNPERGGVNPPARMTSQPLRPTRLLTFIGSKEGDNVTIYTSYGGPAAPRLPGDSTLTTEEEKAEAVAFWATHALSDAVGGPSWEEAEAEVKALEATYMSSL